MAEVMKLGELGEALIKSFERLELKTYIDSGYVRTIGWGHTAAAGGYIPVAGSTITADEAQEIFLHDIAGVVADVNRLVKVPLNQDQFDALVSFQFNTGGLAKSTLLSKLNGGDYISVPSELLKWSKCRVHGQLVTLSGLVARRRAEVQLWLEPTPDEPPHNANEARASQEVAPPQSKGMSESKIGSAAIAIGSIGCAGAASAAGGGAGSGFMGEAVKFAYASAPFVFCVLGVLAALVWYWRAQNMKHEVS